MTAAVTIENLEKTYAGADRKALQRLSLDVPAGAFFSILGPSGCGKTTLLRILAGFERPTAGRVLIDGADVTDVPPRARDIAMVFQDYALYPHMTVRQNITFNLFNRKIPAREIEQRLGETAAALAIERHLSKYPAQLSGGERQRVALGRALIRKPRVFLMDEPLSNLDLKLRETMRLELGRLHERLGVTIVYVTHDQVEAMTLSTAVAILHNGALQQVAQPDAVYAAPANVFVARFIGSPSMNLFRGRWTGGGVQLSTSAPVFVPISDRLPLEEGAQVLLGARPHELSLMPPGPDRLAVRVSFSEHMGRSDIAVCAPESADVLHQSDVVQVETPPGGSPPKGSPRSLAFQPARLSVFSMQGDAILRPAPADRRVHRAIS